MPIVTLQRQFRELGRIRLGQQVEFERNGRKLKRPEKLGTWRLTSPDRKALEAAAAEYGGEVVAWPEAPDGDEWQLVTTVDEIEILVPPGRPLSQWNEMWSGGGCQRRCDGEREWLRNTPCLCPADPVERNELAAKGEACKPTTRLQVILPKLPDLGTWLYVSHGYYAAVELAGTADLLAAAATGGRMIGATLWIDQRTVRRPGQQTRKFPVPAIRIHETMTQLLAGNGGSAPALTGRMPAQLTTSAPLPDDPSFTQPAEGETAAAIGRDAASTTPRPADAPPCAHPAAEHRNTDAGVVCGQCGLLMAHREQPATAGDAAPSVAAEGGADAPASPTPQPAQSRRASPPGPSSAAPASPSLAVAQQSFAAALIAQHLVPRLDGGTKFWQRAETVMGKHNVELPPDEEAAQVLAEWDALTERVLAGEFAK